MVNVTKHGVILNKTDSGFENEGVLNPAAIRVGNKVHLYYRAVSKGNYSSIGYCLLNGPLLVEERLDMPLLFPQFEFESHGVEDPRISKINGQYYLCYTAYDGVNALGAVAFSKDLKQFEKQGLMVPQLTYDEFKHLATCKGTINEKYNRYNNRDHLLTKPGKKILLWDKNVMFFPKRINGLLYFLHRVRPDIQIASINDLQDLTKDYWENYFMNLGDHILLSPKYDHEVSYIGGGCPPIETKDGWLVIYHGVHDTNKGYVYSACAALLDLKNPTIEIARLPYPLFKPELEWELKGEVNNVCFPTGSVVFDDLLYIYYGAADERIACASVNLTELISELLLNVKTHEE
ncbi:MAG: pesticidal protein Cry7Aa [Saprospiraceae bacterium]|nr:pesticidal protein Cry7Aa [Saprospiraceae bacterium]MBK9728840.1 pesticidal protein Cry7Aa [Saprospiraceae bacterium]